MKRLLSSTSLRVVLMMALLPAGQAATHKQLAASASIRALGQMAGTRSLAAALALFSLLAWVPFAAADCYYGTNGGGCVLLSYPDTTGNCNNYYTQIIDQISPNSVCYDGYYSNCLCATYAATTDCLEFADFSETDYCPDDWITVGNGLVEDTGDITCDDPTVSHVPSAATGGCPDVPTVYTGSGATPTTPTTPSAPSVPSGPSLQCCSTMCLTTC